MLPWLIVAFFVGCLLTAVLMWRDREARRKGAERLGIDLAEVKALLQSEREKTVWTDETKRQMENAFKALASTELEARSEQLKVVAKAELSSLISPLQNELTQLDLCVKELEVKREGAYTDIKTQITTLVSLQSSLQQQTTTLAQALRAPTVRGRWGEVQLRRLVELAGMQDHVDFNEQVSIDSKRPDMIIQLPQGGILPIDAKVPLDAFLDAMETDDERTRKQSLERYLGALRDRISELGQKAYWSQFQRTPEFIVMFVPVESALGAAFQQDATLFEYAMGHRVVVSSPIVLFALLKAVVYGWQQQKVAENAERIAREGSTLYERLSKFTELLSDTGKKLQDCVEKYNAAVGSFESRLLPAARRFQEFGLSTKETEPLIYIEQQPRLPLSGENG